MLDTNICIYLMKHQPLEVRARFDECFVGEVVISAITLAELEFGVAASGEMRARNQAALDSFVVDIPVAPFEQLAARAYGPLRAANREGSRDAMDNRRVPPSGFASSGRATCSQGSGHSPSASHLLISAAQ